MSKKTVDPVDEYIEWCNQDHETYIPPAIMKGYIPPADGHVSTLGQRAAWSITRGTQAVISLTLGATTGFCLYCLTIASQNNPTVGALSILGLSAMAILGPMVVKKFDSNN
ncbi:hypothetical protein [Roseateles sp. PN1]|uniref:hypothetical protein n=1 Tax=Roseateles sp. PN1 TaxID=3137372 RepID=UPI003139CD92